MANRWISQGKQFAWFLPLFWVQDSISPTVTGTQTCVNSVRCLTHDTESCHDMRGCWKNSYWFLDYQFQKYCAFDNCNNNVEDDNDDGGDFNYRADSITFPSRVVSYCIFHDHQHSSSSIILIYCCILYVGGSFQHWLNLPQVSSNERWFLDAYTHWHPWSRHWVQWCCCVRIFGGTIYWWGMTTLHIVSYCK